MATISSLITELRTDISDDASTRFTDTQILNIFKKAIRRANRIVQKYGIQFAKQSASLSTVASQAYIDISSAVSDFDVWYGLFDDANNTEIIQRTEKEWETDPSATALSYCRLDQRNSKIYINGTTSTVKTVTLWYYPTIDPSAYTTASSTPWSGRLDDIIMEYVGLRLKNIDEMNVQIDQSFLADMEAQIVNAYATNSPLQVEGAGWMANMGD